MEHLTSWELVQCCAETPEPEAWSAFVDRFGRRLAAGVCSAFRRAGVACPQEELDDVVQEVYCRLLRRGRAALHACRGREDCEVDAYLFRLAQRVALDHLRARAAVRRGGDVPHVADDDGSPADGLASREPSPEDRTLLAEHWRLLASRCRGREDCEVDAYLFRLAQRVALDHLRARAAVRRGGDVPHVADDDGSPADGLASREPSPEDRTLLAEHWRLLASRCRGSSDSEDLDRRLLIWSLRDGLTSSEIARRLRGRIGPSGIDTRLHRMRHRLAAEGLLLPRRTAVL